MGFTVPLAERIREMAERWNMRPDEVADDAIFSQVGHSRGSISDEFRAAGSVDRIRLTLCLQF